jgi:hypothetical protein
MDLTELKERHAALITRVGIMEAFLANARTMGYQTAIDKIAHDLRVVQEEAARLGREIEGYSKPDSQL